MTPRSVLLVTPRWTRDGGVAAHVKASAGAMADRGMDVRVLAARIDPGEELPGVTLHESPELFRRNVNMQARLGDAVADAPEVVHLHQVDDPQIVTALQSAAPVVISAHGYTACTSGVYYFEPGQECTRGHGLGCVPNLLARGCAHTRHRKTLPVKFRNATRGRSALERADLAVSYSSAVDRHLAANGIGRRMLVPYFPTMPARHGSGHSGRRRVVFAGRIVWLKGIEVLIRAATQVEAEFVVCGDGRELDHMREQARRLGVDERVRFTGWLGAEELAGELADASLVVLPSLWPEPFGLVGIEAFAASRPAVASATGGVGDWLEHGVNGLGVPPADADGLAGALNELLADPERQRLMGIAGRDTVTRRFSAETHLAALFEGYQAARATWEAGRGSAEI
jgi:glycosyltransferase involved in cell wall biosynthesis